MSTLIEPVSSATMASSSFDRDPSSGAGAAQSPPVKEPAAAQVPVSQDELEAQDPSALESQVEVEIQYIYEDMQTLGRLLDVRL